MLLGEKVQRGERGGEPGGVEGGEGRSATPNAQFLAGQKPREAEQRNFPSVHRGRGRLGLCSNLATPFPPRGFFASVWKVRVAVGRGGSLGQGRQRSRP